MLIRYEYLTKHERDLFDILIENHMGKGYLNDKSQVEYCVFKKINRLRGSYVCCINYWSHKHKQTVQSTPYSIRVLNNSLRKRKLEKIKNKNE